MPQGAAAASGNTPATRRALAKTPETFGRTCGGAARALPTRPLDIEMGDGLVVEHGVSLGHLASDRLGEERAAMLG
eukprot:scaffold90441_cov45-Phaeocystis_antarctica.AAC.1